MMPWVRGRGTLGRHVIHYILHRPFYKRALCWSGAVALGEDSSLKSSWKDGWKLAGDAEPMEETFLCLPQGDSVM